MDRNLNYTIRVNLVDQASNSADGVNRRLQQMAESAQQAAPRFNQLNMSIQQVARELPAFSYSISTGFMAISNNLPILAPAHIGRHDYPSPEGKRGAGCVRATGRSRMAASSRFPAILANGIGCRCHSSYHVRSGDCRFYPEPVFPV